MLRYPGTSQTPSLGEVSIIYLATELTVTQSQELKNLLTPDPLNMVPGPYPRVRAAPGNFCQLLSVQLQEQPESAITKALAQNMGSPRVV